MSAVIITVSLVISTVTLLVIARLRDLGGDPGAADGRELWPVPDLPVTAELRALRE
ncbi:hypothetical protein [Williamsia herbipolensis]|uniref:Uncharacterized protein n=1 Tax=Williamsia herbipolensis TaxID=1603258 RepID=A0AAU4JWV0_9NOCA|nr:hypothetical protein [Williamsia herbipolensis]